MRRIAVTLLVLSMLISQGVLTTNHPDNESNGVEYASCSGEDKLIEERHQTLLWKKTLEMQQQVFSNSVQPTAVIPTYAGSTLMPSIGSVKMLVLPVSFPDYPQYKDNFDITEWESRFFSPYSPELNPWEQSVRGFYYRESYGKLDIIGTVLPAYEAPLKSSAYASSDDMLAQLTADALEYYCEHGLDLSEFDNDGDGFIDALVVHQLRRKFSSAEPDGEIKSLLGRQVGNCCIDNYALISFSHLSASEDQLYEHEIGHLLGLLDNYRNGDNKLDVNLYELMFGIGYINMYYKYLLGWIDPIILTNEDQVGTVELSPVELQPNGVDTPPKALVLIPNMVAFPFTEYYMIEYRKGGMKRPMDDAEELIYDISPGIVIWHCNTVLNSYQQYKYQTNYIKPIYKNGTDRYSEKDIYVAGDEFSPISTPNSNFYDDVYTGAYLKVEDITQDKAVLRAGFRDPNLSPEPVIEISLPSKQVIKKGEASKFVITTVVGDELFPLNRDSAKGLRTISTLGTITEVGIQTTWSASQNPMTVTVQGYDYKTGAGDGIVWVDIPAGAIRYNGKDSAAVTSEKIYVDNTPPEITLNGDNPQRLQQGMSYTELGAVASDNLDPDIEGKLQIDSSKVNINTPGTYTVTYSVTDHAGHTATVERTIIVEEKTPPHMHQYSSEWSNNGSKHWHECVCGDRGDEAIHIPVTDPAVEATCTTPGKTEGSHCSVCGYVITAQTEILPLEHNYSLSWEKDSASHWHECSKCHNKRDLAAHTEDTGTVTKQPTLEETGIKTYFCSVCGYEMRTEILDKLEPSHTHSYAEIWSKDGVSHWHECVCGDRGDEAVHIPEIDPAVEATCTTPGKTEGSHCSVCGYIITAQTEISAIGHSYLETWSHNASEHWRQCLNCDARIEIASHAWDGGVETKAPTATTPGIKTYTCTVCAETKTEPIPATGDPVDPGPGPIQPVTPPPTREPEPTETPQPQPPIETEPPATEKKEFPFTDVKASSWYYAAVDRMYQEGLMGGTSQTTFSPSIPASRAMLVTVLYRLEREPAVTNLTSFLDVKAKWCAPAIAWAAEREIVLGYGNGNFGPNDEITREQVAAILFRYARQKGWDTTARDDLSQYSDSGKVHKYAREAMEWAVGTGLIGGRTQDWLAPRETTTRAELAVMLTRLITMEQQPPQSVG